MLGMVVFLSLLLNPRPSLVPTVFGHDYVTSGCSSDLRNATSVATRMVRNYGYSEKIGPVWLERDAVISSKTREDVENEIRT